MSDQQQTPTPEQPKPEQPKAETPAAPKDADGYAVAFRSLQADASRLQKELEAERAKVAALAGERDTLKAQVDHAGKQQRESAVVEAIRSKLPHLTPFEIRGTLLALHDEGAVDRYSDKPDDAATAAVAAMSTKAPALLRPPAQGGGPNGAPPQTQGRKTKSLVWG